MVVKLDTTQKYNSYDKLVDEDEKLTYTICNSGQGREMWFLAKDVAEWIEHDGTSVSSMCKLVDKDEVVKMFCTLSYSNNHPKQVMVTRLPTIY